MIKQFTVRVDELSGRYEIQNAVVATLKALGSDKPRVLVTRVFDRIYDVTMATDEELTLKP